MGSDSHERAAQGAARDRAARTVAFPARDPACDRGGLPILLLVFFLLFLLFLFRPSTAKAAEIHCGSDIRLQLQMRPVPAHGLRLQALAQGKAAGTDIVLNARPGLTARPAALAAWNEAVAIWEAVLDDPITVQIDGDMAALGAGVLGSTQATAFASSYTNVRNAMANDAAANESLANSLPTLAQKQISLPPGFVDSGSVVGTKANLKALGFDLSFNLDPDATIVFSSGFENQFDYDPADGIAAGKYDFVAIVVHEIGHALGFTSEVDAVDYYRGAGQTAVVYPRALDLYRLLPGAAANFATASRCLKSGDLEPVQICFDGGTEWAMSTGVRLGDGRQASHWKADELSGSYIGIMDPTLSTGQSMQLTQHDLRMLGLIGWNVPGPAPTPAPSAPTTAFGLRAYPNPFNPRTSITLRLPEAGWVTVELFNAAGQRLNTLYAGELPAGDHSFLCLGRDFAGRSLASGIYFVRAQGQSARAVLKLVLSQ